ncbi:MAG: hypothetical protein DRO99_01300 [Candidatus Aenigmatarchaeota archaeon]|nr:MAG: hypothetical protein DRO99_01300 [Candidatus Aenigmarchaeota archaeon]
MPFTLRFLFKILNDFFHEAGRFNQQVEVPQGVLYITLIEATIRPSADMYPVAEYRVYVAVFIKIEEIALQETLILQPLGEPAQFPPAVEGVDDSLNLSLHFVESLPCWACSQT